MRPSVAPATSRAAKQFADDVEYYLSLTPRQLPSRYLYDELGSALFEAICRLPWYRITRAEQRLLETHGAAIISAAAPLSLLVELGPGSGEKLATLIDASPLPNDLEVHLVDVSPAALDTATRTLAAGRDLAIVTHRASYEAGLELATRRRRTHGRTMTLFLGSNLGNFDPPGADAFLANIRASLESGDLLLVGTDLVKSEPELLLAYDDPLGITAAFNRNLLVRINRELGADFDVEGFAHRAVWDDEESRVEMHLESLRPQRVVIPSARLDLMFERGERIWTESSYKYRPDDVVATLDRAGFHTVSQWIDERDGFALTLADAY